MAWAYLRVSQAQPALILNAGSLLGKVEPVENWRESNSSYFALPDVGDCLGKHFI